MKQASTLKRINLIAISLVLSAVGLTGLFLQAAHASPLPTDVTIDGFSTPESVLYDKKSDTYLVSNINGAPLDHDDNGFVSRVSPDGQITELKWIDGASADVTLHAPKGMAIADNKLYITDIDTVRVFDRESGHHITSITVPGSTFLNDLAADKHDTVYISDSGLDSSFQPTGTDAVYRLQDDQLATLASGTALLSPNGLAVTRDSVLVATFNSNVIFRINKTNGDTTEFAHTPSGGLDGLVRLRNGTVYVSSWGGNAVYKIARDGTVTTEMSDTTSPADIGLDSKRSRLLIPLFTKNQVVLHSVR